MQTRPLKIAGAWCHTPQVFRDPRGMFLEWFTQESIAAVAGTPMPVAQGNLSVSAAGVLRGIHFAQMPPGQAKYVTCVSGAVLDVVVDIRVGSPTFGEWDTVLLDDIDRRAVQIDAGLGHAFMSLADGSAVTYLVSQPYAPGREHGIFPLDPDLGIDWPSQARDGSSVVPLLSDKDQQAPTLREAEAQGLLPAWNRPE